MSLEQPYVYKVCHGVKYTQNEETKILNLLRDVRKSVALLRPDLAHQRLDSILEVVEKGKWIIQKKVNLEENWVEINYNIDLSEAKQLVDRYRHNSEGGCQSCEKYGHFMPFQGEHVFKRKLEELLEGQN